MYHQSTCNIFKATANAVIATDLKHCNSLTFMTVFANKFESILISHPSSTNQVKSGQRVRMAPCSGRMFMNLKSLNLKRFLHIVWELDIMTDMR